MLDDLIVILFRIIAGVYSFYKIKDVVSDVEILGSGLQSLGQQAFPICTQILFISRQSCPYMKIFEQLSLGKSFDTMEHNSKRFL